MVLLYRKLVGNPINSKNIKHVHIYINIITYNYIKPCVYYCLSVHQEHGIVLAEKEEYKNEKEMEISVYCGICMYSFWGTLFDEAVCNVY